MLRPRPLARVSVVGVILAAALVPSGALAQARRIAVRPAGPKPFLDVRDVNRRAVARRGAVSLRAPDARTRSARARLRAGGAVVEIDPLAGTPRLLLGRAAPLSAPASGDRGDVAERYLRTHLAALGLAAADLGSLRLERRRAIPGGAELLGWSQYADGIPSFDGGLRVAVDAAGRVVGVSGAAQPGLALNATAPTLTAVQAMRALSDDVGVRPPRAVAGPAGPRRTTAFAGGETAALVAFAEGTRARLGWELDLRAGPAAHYAAVVDAASGRILYRANRVKAAANDALAWEQYPGATRGGTAQVRDLTPYLNAGATDLSGPFAHAWSDTNDNDSGTTSGDGHIVPLDHPDAGEAVGRSGGSFTYPFTPFTQAAGGCDDAHKCSWNFDTANSWQTNRAQNAVQAFYYVNRYRDHLHAAPISFTPADGDFEGADRVLVNADDGAALPTTVRNGPFDGHFDNAYMDTPPNGTSPTMAMFLFIDNHDFRDANGGDDAAIVYHEYTHGLSGRLVTVNPSGGEEALNGPQSGGMGEGWSDWYAKDFLVGQFPADDTAAAGDVDMGKYIDSAPHTIRSQGLDCPVGAAAAQCPGTPAQGSGGYTYGDFNATDIDPSTGQHEVHEAGEIWGETLWDLRAAVGSEVARAIVTQGMRISPPEPTFLDERDAILTADRQLFPGANHNRAIWRVFAARGMGSDARSLTQNAVVEGFQRPAPTAALSIAPSPAVAGSPVTFDASGSTDPDGRITSFDFDFDGDGVQDVTGTTNPRQSFTYNHAGTFHPAVTVHDDGGQTATAARQLDVSAASPATGSPPPGGTPPAPGATPPRRPAITLARKGTKGRVRLTIRCDSACAGSARLTVSRRLAKRLHLTRRTVGTLRVTLTKAGRTRFTVTLSKRTLRAMRRAGLRRATVKLSVTVSDAARQRSTKRRSVSIRR